MIGSTHTQLGFREQIVAAGPANLATTFAALASKESDCGSAQAGGDLGEFGRGAMQKAFEDVRSFVLLSVNSFSSSSFSLSFNPGEFVSPIFLQATYALKVGELSDVVDSDSGLHIILRTA